MPPVKEEIHQALHPHGLHFRVHEGERGKEKVDPSPPTPQAPF